MIDIVNVGYDSTNYYVLGNGDARLLVDVGMPGTLPKLRAQLKRKGIPLEQIGYLLATHYHPDHAGIAQDLKNQGVRLIVLLSQLAGILLLKTYVKADPPFLDIALHDNLRLAADDSRRFLRSIGIQGTIIATPGHSDDCVTLVLDEGAAFTGDLPPPFPGDPDPQATIARSWRAIHALKATTIYPGHGPVRPVPPLVE
jgi:ribonuclease/clavin/mitogillin